MAATGVTISSRCSTDLDILQHLLVPMLVPMLRPHVRVERLGKQSFGHSVSAIDDHASKCVRWYLKDNISVFACRVSDQTHD